MTKRKSQEKVVSVDLSMVHGVNSISGQYTALEIYDPSSRARIRIEMDADTLGKMIRGGGRDNRVRGTFINVEQFGRKRLLKTKKVWLKSTSDLPYKDRDAYVRKLAERFEVNGWIFTGPQDSWSKDDQGTEGKRHWVRLSFKKYVDIKVPKTKA